MQSKLFRTPAGVITPPLLRIASRLDLKIILWAHRFYDALWTLEPKHIKHKIDYFKNGEIILLHDRQRLRNRKKFIGSLKILLETMSQKQFAMAPIIEQEIK